MDSYLQCISPEQAIFIIEAIPRHSGKTSMVDDDIRQTIESHDAFELEELEVRRLAARNGIYADDIWEPLKQYKLKPDFHPLIIDETEVVLDGFHRLCILWVQGVETVQCYRGIRK